MSDVSEIDYESSGSNFTCSEEEYFKSTEDESGGEELAVTKNSKKITKKRKTYDYKPKPKRTSTENPGRGDHLSPSSSLQSSNGSMGNSSLSFFVSRRPTLTNTHVPSCSTPITSMRQRTDQVTPAMTTRTRLESKIKSLDSRLENMEKRQGEILEIQKQILAKLSAPSPVDSVSKKPVMVSKSIRSVVRDGYASGKDTSLEWILRRENQKLRPDSDVNKPMTDYIKNFVLGVYPSTSEAVIKAATSRYFTSLKEKSQRQTSGKATLFNNRMVRYQRKKRKLRDRKLALSKKSSWDENKKKKVSAVMDIEFMSSEFEESSDDESVFKIVKLPWRSSEINTCFEELDKKSRTNDTKLSKRQKIKRVQSDKISNRPCPEINQDVAWAIRSDFHGLEEQ